MSKSSIVTGAVFSGFALLTALVWIPLDVETGLIEVSRRQTVIGDSLAPLLAATFIFVGGMLIAFEHSGQSNNVLSLQNLRYAGLFLAIILSAFALMRWAGPILVMVTNFFLDEPLSYRLLRDTPGWKHVGYLLGGTFLITSLISLVVGRVTLRTVFTAIIAVLVMIGVYDLPFDDLLLPPNGDV